MKASVSYDTDLSSNSPHREALRNRRKKFANMRQNLSLCHLCPIAYDNWKSKCGLCQKSKFLRHFFLVTFRFSFSPHFVGKINGPKITKWNKSPSKAHTVNQSLLMLDWAMLAKYLSYMLLESFATAVCRWIVGIWNSISRMCVDRQLSSVGGSLWHERLFKLENVPRVRECDRATKVKRVEIAIGALCSIIARNY